MILLKCEGGLGWLGRCSLKKVSTPESDWPMDSMLNFSEINGYYCIVIAYIIETVPASYH